MNPCTLVQKWGKLPPHLEDNDVQGFPNEELSKFKIPDIMLCAVVTFENTDRTHDYQQSE
jgi:hypothetical protein